MGIAILVIVIVVGASVAGYYLFAPSKTSPTSTSTSSTSGAVISGGTLVIEDACCIDSLDPAEASSTEGLSTIAETYQALLEYPGNSTSPVPILAQSYVESPDGLTYNFTLRQNITFSNGDPFNSYDVWYSFYREQIMAGFEATILTPALNMSWNGITAGMLNSFNTTNDIPPPSLLQVMESPKNAITVTGPYSLTFHLFTAWAPFLVFLTYSDGMVVDPAVVSQQGGVVAGQVNSWMTTHMVGTGPFVEAGYIPSEQIILKRNPTYWGGVNGVQTTPHLDEVVIKYSTSSETRLEDLERNASQFSVIELAQATQIAGNPNLYIPNIGVVPQIAAIGLDCEKFPFNNTLIRQAVMHAINYTELLSFFGPGGEFGVRTNGPIPQGMLGYAPDVPLYSYDLTLAKQLLAEAGYPGGQGIPTVPLIAVTDDPPSVQVDTVVVANLAQIGINVQVKSMNYASESVLLGYPGTSANYPAMTYQDWVWQTDPWAYAMIVAPGCYGMCNYAWYNNTQVNDLFQKAAYSTNQTERAILYDEISHIVYNDAPYIWIGQFKNCFTGGVPVLSTHLQGLVYNANSFLEGDLTQLYFVS